MRKCKRGFVGLVLFVMLFLLSVVTVTADSSGAKLNKTKVTLYSGKTTTIKLNGGKIKSVKSSNKKVATIKKSGLITAKKSGTATITVTSTKNKKYVCKVTVKARLSKKNLSLKAGSTSTIKLYGETVKSVKSSNKKIATITKKGVIKAKKAGTATILVTSTKGKTYKCKVKVKAYLTKNTAVLLPNESLTVKLKGATVKSVKSSNKSVATVTKKGKITAKAEGTATITFTATNKKTYKCTVKVEKPSLNKNNIVLRPGDTYELRLLGTTQQVTWSSENAGVASVMSNGKVTAEAIGTAQIVAKLPSGKTWKCAVTVAMMEPATTYTRGEWVNLIAGMVEMNLGADPEKIDYYYGDTEGTTYAVAIETAQAYGLLPAPVMEDADQDVPEFHPNEIATREFAAYTAVKAMGFNGDHNADVSSWKDWDDITYQNEAAIAVKQGAMRLFGKYFYPEFPAGNEELALIETCMDKLEKSVQVSDGNEKDQSVYQKDVMKEELETITSYAADIGEDRATAVLPKTNKTDDIRVGDVIVLPGTAENPAGLAMKVQRVQETGNGIQVSGTEPELAEVFSEIEFAGNATALVDQVVPSDGVSYTYDPGIATYGRFGGSTEVPGKLAFDIPLKKFSDDLKAEAHVEISIPDVTCIMDVDVGLFSGIDVNEFTFSVQEEIKVDATLECTLAESGYELTNSLGNTRFEAGRIELGRVPFAIGTTGLSIDLVFFFNVSAKGDLSISYTMNMTEGYQYKNGSSRVIWDFSDDLTALEIKGSASAGIGMAADICAFSLMDLVGYSAEGGIAFNASFDLHTLATDTLYCGDVTLYAYAKHGLDQETAIGKFLKEVCHFTLEFEPLKNDANNPYKLKFHVENGDRVPECTFGVGGIEGVVQDFVTKEMISGARIQVYNGENLIRTKYTGADGTYYFDNLTQGTYKVVVSATGYYKYEIMVEVTSHFTTYQEATLMVDRENTSESSIATGQILDAVTGNGIYGASYELRKGGNNTTGEILASGIFETDIYQISLGVGNYTLRVTKEGYVSNTIHITVSDTMCSAGDVVLSPDNSGSLDGSGELRVVLTWGQYPRDLDSHMFGPIPSDPASRFHICYYDRYAYDYELDEYIGDLDLDDTSSYGPETVTVSKMANEGVYSYYVHDYTNRYDYYSSEMANSDAKVQIYLGSTLYYTFNIPTGRVGNVWHVFDYDTVTDRISPVNTVSYASDMEDVDSYALVEVFEDVTQEEEDIRRIIALPEKMTEAEEMAELAAAFENTDIDVFVSEEVDFTDEELSSDNISAEETPVEDTEDTDAMTVTEEIAEEITEEEDAAVFIEFDDATENTEKTEDIENVENAQPVDLTVFTDEAAA